MGKHKNDVPRLLAMCRYYLSGTMTPDTYVRYLAAKEKIMADSLEFAAAHNHRGVWARVAAYRNVCGMLRGAREMRRIMREQS